MSGQCNLSRLDDNLFAIANRGSSKLISDPGDSVLKGSWSIDGRKWTYYYDSMALFFGSQYNFECKLVTTLTNIKNEFGRCLELLESIDQRYKKGLATNPGLAKELRSEESEILGIGRKCSFLASREMLFCPQSAFRIVQDFFLSKMQAPLVTNAQFETLHCYGKNYAIASVAGIIQLHYPTHIFKKLVNEEALARHEIATLNEWVSEVQTNCHRMNVWLLHLALSGLCELFFKEVTQPAYSLADVVGILEWRLFQGGLHFFEVQDQMQIEWVRKLGSIEPTIQLGDKSLRIGRLMQWKAIEEQHSAVFELPDDPSQLLLVGPNRALLGIWQTICHFCARDVQPVKITYKDPEFRFCLIEKVDHPVATIEWQTQGQAIAHEIHAQDRLFLETLIDFLAWLADKLETPNKLSIHTVFMKTGEKKCQLRALLPFDDNGPHDFLLLEKFAFECAKGNNTIFSSLMHKSGLFEHPVACFFRRMIQTKLVCAESGLSIRDEALLDRITDIRIAERANNLLTELRPVFIRLLNRLLLKLKTQAQASKLQEVLLNHVMQLYHESGYCSSLLPALTDERAVKAIEEGIIAKWQELF